MINYEPKKKEWERERERKREMGKALVPTEPAL
jgi:hypothetical protein